MSKQKEIHKEDSFENVENALSRSEQFIEDNQNRLMMGLLVVVVLVAGYWGTKKFYFQPMEKNAQEQVFYAQQYFEKDSFKLALNGDGMNLGFADIIDEFGSTSVGELSKYYAGICNLQLGNFQEAADYLSSFSTSEEMIAATAAGALGDAYSELGQNDNAISQYKKATAFDNELTTPVYLMKLGLMYETAGNQEAAVKAYTAIKEQYQNSTEARQIDKYLTRAKLQLNK